MGNDKFFREIIETIKGKQLSKDQINKIKIKLCAKHKIKKIPTDIEILLNAKSNEISNLKLLQTKPTRSLSGVAVVAIMTKPLKCPHGKCTMCPGGPESEFGDVPQSYTGKEPATRRAIRNLFDPYLQVFNRLEQYVVSGHVPEKIELIIMGGTFPSYLKKYQTDFVMNSLKAMNDFSKLFFKRGMDINKFKNFFELPGDINSESRAKRLRKKILLLKKSKSILKKEQKKNENSIIKCVGITIETRPDYSKLEHVNQMLDLGCTRVELGVQTVYNKILEKIERGHSVEDSIEATKILKDCALKVNYHLMPGLPGVSKKKDLEGLKKIFLDENFRPDMLKIYPCMVLKGTKLYDEWKKGKFIPLSTKTAAELIVEFKKIVPEYVRIMRVQRDIPTMMTESGVDKTNLRQYIHQLMDKKGINCSCIRCRESGRKNQKFGDYDIKILSYESSEGVDFFISAEQNNCILGFVRLRFPSTLFRKEITNNSGLIRELHVYGEASSLEKIGKIQHRGIGKKLLKQAETIAKKNSKNKIVIISGIGVRNYYRKLGYKKQGPYMVKKI